MKNEEWDKRERIIDYTANVIRELKPILDKFLGIGYLSDEEKENLK